MFHCIYWTLIPNKENIKDDIWIVLQEQLTLQNTWVRSCYDVLLKSLDFYKVFWSLLPFFFMSILIAKINCLPFVLSLRKRFNNSTKGCIVIWSVLYIVEHFKQFISIKKSFLIVNLFYIKILNIKINSLHCKFMNGKLYIWQIEDLFTTMVIRCYDNDYSEVFTTFIII